MKFPLFIYTKLKEQHSGYERLYAVKEVLVPILRLKFIPSFAFFGSFGQTNRGLNRPRGVNRTVNSGKSRILTVTSPIYPSSKYQTGQLIFICQGRGKIQTLIYDIRYFAGFILNVPLISVYLFIYLFWISILVGVPGFAES